MCLIIANTEGKQLDEEIVPIAERINPDGFGIVYLDNGELHRSLDYKKVAGKTTLEHLMSERPYIAHYRKKTAGNKAVSNCHPAWIGKPNKKKGSLLFMNGTLPGIAMGDKSDTRVLASKLGKIPPRYWEHVLSLSDNRYATVSMPDIAKGAEDALNIFNRDLWTERDEILFSKENCFPVQKTVGYGWHSQQQGHYQYQSSTPQKYWWNRGTVHGPKKPENKAYTYKYAVGATYRKPKSAKGGYYLYDNSYPYGMTEKGFNCCKEGYRQCFPSDTKELRLRAVAIQINMSHENKEWTSEMWDIWRQAYPGENAPEHCVLDWLALYWGSKTYNMLSPLNKEWARLILKNNDVEGCDLFGPDCREVDWTRFTYIKWATPKPEHKTFLSQKPKKSKTKDCDTDRVFELIQQNSDNMARVADRYLKTGSPRSETFDSESWRGCNILAVYGTLKRGMGNHSLLGDAEFLGMGFTNEKFLLKDGSICLQRPENQSDSNATHVPVEVYRLPKCQRDSVDMLEGHPDRWRREITEVTVSVDDEGAVTKAWIYVYQPVCK